MSKTVLLVLSVALFGQSVLSQCLNRGIAGNNLGWNGLGLTRSCGSGVNGLTGYGPGLAPGLPSPGDALNFTPTSGGGLLVTSASPLPPTGITVASENAYEGVLAVTGELPFIGSTAMEGIVPSNGAAVVNHECGNGVTAAVAQPVSGPVAGAYGSVGSIGAVGPVNSVGAIGPVGPFGAAGGSGAGFGRGLGLGCGRGLY